MDTMHAATWRGGPWDGKSISVIDGEKYFPIYAPDPSPDASAQPRHNPYRCPVVLDPDGRWIIDWDNRLSPSAEAPTTVG